jgi:prepilin peptidase CpaA
MYLGLSATALTATCVGIAVVTDLRRRRIPNWLTFPAIALGLALWTGFVGWKGLAVSAGGMLAAPMLLVLLHLGRSPGMGDIKLAAGVGALLGIRLSLVAMLLAAVAGGLLALGYQMRQRGSAAGALSLFFVGIPGLDGWARANPAAAESTSPATVPYAVGIAAGTLLALAVYWCTANESWLF